MTRLAEAAERLAGVLCTAIDQRRDRMQMRLLAVGTGDIVASAGNLDVDIGHQ